ncbi:MAG: hypothetical protein ACHQHO_07560 [Solirubrobacterales bacterium]
MRHIRLLGVASALCAFAIAATPALAHEFTASKTGRTSGKAESEQKFKFGPFKITCEKAKAKGEQAAGSSSTLTVAVRFVSCTDEIRFGTKPAFVPTRFLTPLAIAYHANGYVETGSEIEEFEGSAVLAGGEAEIKVYTGVIPGTPKEKSHCTILWPEQTIPLKAIKKPEGEYSEATYSNEVLPRIGKNFPDSLQHFVNIANSFKGIKYEFEGEPCEEWGKEEGSEGGGATYFGSFPVFANGGNLEFS